MGCADARFEEAQTADTLEAYEGYLGGETTEENRALAIERMQALRLASAEEDGLEPEERARRYTRLFAAAPGLELTEASRRRYAEHELALLQAADLSATSTAENAFNEAADRFREERSILEQAAAVTAERRRTLAAEGLLGMPRLTMGPEPAADVAGLWRTETGVALDSSTEVAACTRRRRFGW
ncbi:MAG: hypothetical protein AB8I08_15665 [Sandaracinaceae bacterium]